MKIAVLDFECSRVDIVTVDEKWLRNDLRDALPEWYDDDEWADKDESELIDLFLCDYCGYSSGEIYYMVDFSQVRYTTPKDYN